ncbi:efflux transporter outer membrane subunit [Pseudoduganella namucuonensis]|uniref:Efflux transporter, outer membrane factor (OMF) lipoprotein, NodT family n=1 Tax=Pseudoduganella namucuonensis TaxID=1035707 RepID=A0A1I7FMB3_9BURK|nr:efflux transporter outer membrane subunit [Pseudoduganella namucuonensis]SFU37320.1 efflux transporter, outer membrane factor (OMF) lipoprotein, NodT family [Pseudoduganella namucuonensis]
MNKLTHGGAPLALAMALALSGCALTAPPAKVEAAAPAQWQAPLPHNGSLTDLSGWWRGQGDALLAQLVDAAQAASPTLGQARARVAQSRAERVAAGAALVPGVDFGASVQRMSQQSAIPTGTTIQGALQASWEIDVFGGGRAARDAAQARLDGANAGWHEARVSVAAETANQYYALRACEQLQLVAAQDAGSRAHTARLVELSSKAGFTAPADAALARASAADGRNRANAQRAACDNAVKALVALTAIAEPELRQKLAASPAVPAPAVAIAALPAQVLAQRPDVYSAERDVAAASFDVGGAQAQRWPRVSLAGSIGAANFRTGGENTQLDTWTVGPLAVQIPVFDAGRRRANVDAARARYDAAVLQYQGSVRNAVREVEQAIVTLNSTSERANDAQAALQGYRAAFAAAEDRQKNGLASLLDLEDARRLRLAAENTVVSLQQERSAAWIALYRAAGGGWNAAAAAPPSSAPAPTNTQ